MLQKTILSLLLFVGFASQSSGGPGTIGGNPGQYINSIRHNYLFQSALPTTFSFKPGLDFYRSDLLDLNIMIEVIKYDKNVCSQQAVYKTICALKNASNEKDVIIVMDQGHVFRVLFHTTNLKHDLFEGYYQQLMSTFVLGLE